MDFGDPLGLPDIELWIGWAVYRPGVVEEQEHGTVPPALSGTQRRRCQQGIHLGLLQVGQQGPRRVTQREIEDAFARGWKVESIEPSRFEVRPDLKDIAFSEGGPRAWFVVVRRAGRHS